MMNIVNLIRGALLLLCVLTRVQGDGCANRETYGLPVINMCEQRSWTMGRVVISVTSDNMGSNTGCVCVIRSRTPLGDSSTSFLLRGADSNVSRCGESHIQINPFDNFPGSHIQNFTCTSPFESTSYSGRITDDVTITLTRPDTSVGVSYCLLVQPDRYQENDLELSCQSGLTPPSPPSTTSTSNPPSTTTPPTTTTTLSTSVTSTSSITLTPTPTNTTPTTTTTTTPLTTTPPTTTTPTTTTPTTTPPTTTTPTTTTTTTTTSTNPLTPAVTSNSSSPMSSPESSPTSQTSSITTSGGNADGSSTTAGGLQATRMPDSQVAAIAGGVSGAVVLIIIVIIIVVVCKRRRSQQKALIEEQPKVDNQGYFNPGLEDDMHNPHHSFADVLTMGTDRPDSMAPAAKDTASSPETQSLDGLLAASSSPHAMEDDPLQDNGAVSIDATAGSAMMRVDADEAQPPTPGGDLYAVVNKPRHQDPPKSRPEKPPKPASLSTSSNGADVTTPAGGDVYAVVDKSRNKGGNAEKKSSLPSAEATSPPPPSPPADSSPSLVYADLEELKGEGRRSSPPRPPPKKAQETEYAVIDHIATANLAKEA